MQQVGQRHHLGRRWTFKILQEGDVEDDVNSGTVWQLKLVGNPTYLEGLIMAPSTWG
jgi:hypothetical protein